MVGWKALQKTIGTYFNNLSLLKQAFVHSSFVNENPSFPLADNERLEFLGDAILSFVVAENLYQEFAKLPEGELTRIRAWLICQETLARLAMNLKLGDYLYLGRGEETTGGRQRQANLASAFEALIGAIFLDQGLVSARNFVLQQLSSEIDKIKAGEISPDYKTLLQEFVQAKQQQSPVYHLVEAVGPDHDKTFVVEVMVNGEVLSRGSGKSKKTAEQEAARSAWERLATNFP